MLEASLLTLVVMALVAAVASRIRRSQIRTRSTIPDGEWDYIIVGGGLAGSVLASRLSEDASKRVLVIEPGTSSPDSLFIRISGAILKLFRNPAFDWCWQTVAEPGCLGRRIFLCRGKLLGGSSCLNAQLAFRGSPRDYEGWGIGWSTDEISAIFDRIELRQQEPMASCGMALQVPNYQHELSARFLRTCDSGCIHPDLKPRPTGFNDWGSALSTAVEGASDATVGFGRFELSQRNGTRWTGANSYLTIAQARPNVTILTGYVVARVELAASAAAGDAKLAAVGVTVKEVTIASRAANLESAHRHVRRALAKSDPLWRALANRLERTEQQQNGVASSKAIVREWPHSCWPD